MLKSQIHALVSEPLLRWIRAGRSLIQHQGKVGFAAVERAVPRVTSPLHQLLAQAFVKDWQQGKLSAEKDSAGLKMPGSR